MPMAAERRTRKTEVLSGRACSSMMTSWNRVSSQRNAAHLRSKPVAGSTIQILAGVDGLVSRKHSMTMMQQR